MDEFEPITGYERSLKFTLGQVQLDVPYGYLFDYSRRRGKYWPLDNGKVNKVQHLNIVVSDKIFLKPYGTDTKELFLKLIDGKESDGIRILVMPAEKCQKLNIDFAMKVEINDGFTAMKSSNSNYLAYESHEKMLLMHTEPGIIKKLGCLIQP